MLCLRGIEVRLLALHKLRIRERKTSGASVLVVRRLATEVDSGFYVGMTN